MITSQSTETAVQVTLLAATGQPGLAVAPLAQHFELSQSAAAQILAAGQGLVRAAMAPERAQAALPLLAALGVKLAVHPALAAVPVDLVDLSLRLREPGAFAPARQALCRLGWSPDLSPGDFMGPAGLEWLDLPAPQAEGIVAALRAVPGLGVVACRQASAIYDLFAPAGGLQEDGAALLRHLDLLSCGPARHWPALAVGLERKTLAHVLARFAQTGAFGVNQAFQRYDLMLMGGGKISQKDLLDFLATRGRTPQEVLAGLSQNRGLRLEAGLTRPVARQFLADYRQIGLQIRATLAEA